MRIADVRRLLGTAQATALSGERSEGEQLDCARRAAEQGDADETARAFETLFAVQLVRELRRSLPENPFGSGAGADVYEGWFDEHLGAALAERDALGIAGMVKAALVRAQAARDATLESEPGAVP
jgi:Rod binding domain-containing protein